MPIGWASAGELKSTNETGRTYVWYRFAAADNEASPTVTTTSSIRMSALVYRLTGAGAPTATFATGNNPPAHTSPRSGQHRFIAGWTSRRTDNNATAPTTTPTFAGLATAALASDSNTNRTRVSGAHTDCVDGSSIDPGAFTTTGTTDNTHTVTIAVPTPASPPASCPAVSFVASTQTSSNDAANSISLTQPAGVQIGDVLVASIAMETNTSLVNGVPAGWSLWQGVDQSTNIGMLVYTLPVTDVTTTSWEWGFTESKKRSGGIIALRGVRPTPTASGSASRDSSTRSNPWATPSLAVSSAGSVLVALFGSKSAAGDHREPSDMSQRFATSSSDDWRSSGNTEIRSSTGATGPRSAGSADGSWVAVSLVLPPC
jgi:hypothetical protein